MPFLTRVRTVATGVAGTPWYFNFHFLHAASPTDPQPEIDAVTTFWTSLRPMLSSAVSYTTEGDVPVLNLDGTQATILTGAQSTLTGAGVATLAPTSLTALVRERTAVTVNGRALQGRINISGLSIERLDGPNWSAQTVNTITAAANVLEDTLSNGARWAVLSKTGAVAADITGINVPSVPAVLRSRRD